MLCADNLYGRVFDFVVGVFPIVQQLKGEIMKVSDILNRPEGALVTSCGESAKRPMSQEEVIWTVELIANPDNVEILDGKCVFSKRVLARSAQEAIYKVGIQTRQS